MADADRLGPALATAGFEEVSFTAVNEPMILGTDAADAWAFVRSMGIVRGLTQSLDDPTREQALARLRRVLESHENHDQALRAPAIAHFFSSDCLPIR